MNADLKALLSARRRQSRRDAVRAFEKEKKAAQSSLAVSNGFKALVTQMARTPLGRKALAARTNMSNAERTYVAAALNR